MPKTMPQNANDWANISALVQIEAMYQGMHTVYELSIQAVNFKKRPNFPKQHFIIGTFEKNCSLGLENSAWQRKQNRKTYT